MGNSVLRVNSFVFRSSFAYTPQIYKILIADFLFSFIEAFVPSFRLAIIMFVVVSTVLPEPTIAAKAQQSDLSSEVDSIEPMTPFHKLSGFVPYHSLNKYPPAKANFCGMKSTVQHVRVETSKFKEMTQVDGMTIMVKVGSLEQIFAGPST